MLKLETEVCEDMEVEVGEGTTEDFMPELNFVGLYGTVNEKEAAKLVSQLLILQKSYAVNPLEDGSRPQVDVLVSTYGGSAMEMFAIYDAMRFAQSELDISTFGLGKVMSSGTLILAAGTKGLRRIGRNTRLMIHEVSVDVFGPKTHIDLELKESKVIYDNYVSALAETTNLSEKQLRKMIKGGHNVYLSAEQAVELGFADVIV